MKVYGVGVKNGISPCTIQGLFVSLQQRKECGIFMYFGISPTAGTILAIILVLWLIGSGIKSASKKLPEPNKYETMKLKEMRKALGMTWKDDILGCICIFVLAAIFASILYLVIG